MRIIVQVQGLATDNIEIVENREDDYRNSRMSGVERSTYYTGVTKKEEPVCLSAKAGKQSSNKQGLACHHYGMVFNPTQNFLAGAAS